MANGPDFHVKQIIGEIAAQLALVRADNEALREENAALKAQLPADPPKDAPDAPRRPR